MSRTPRTSTRTAARGAAAVLALGLLAAAAPASAADPAAPVAPAVDPALVAAIAASPATDGVPDGAWTVTDVRTADEVWAAALLEPVDPEALDPATALLRATPDGWEVVDLGTAQVGCGTAPDAVLPALGLTC
ncbi:hypothetical protein [Kineococcus sp. SYSU DK004]|uniref:hypothetical protein n=1 Tax=Kineococcus sp. SYSU DK004 TaxID=3383125 RepID=UPI003D7CC87F